MDITVQVCHSHPPVASPFLANHFPSLSFSLSHSTGHHGGHKNYLSKGHGHHGHGAHGGHSGHHSSGVYCILILILPPSHCAHLFTSLSPLHQATMVDTSINTALCHLGDTIKDQVTRKNGTGIKHMALKNLTGMQITPSSPLLSSPLSLFVRLFTHAIFFISSPSCLLLFVCPSSSSCCRGYFLRSLSSGHHAGHHAGGHKSHHGHHSHGSHGHLNSGSAGHHSGHHKSGHGYVTGHLLSSISSSFYFHCTFIPPRLVTCFPFLSLSLSPRSVNFTLRFNALFPSPLFHQTTRSAFHCLTPVHFTLLIWFTCAIRTFLSFSAWLTYQVTVISPVD